MLDAGEFRLARNPIAIVGVAGMFPQAHDVREFWSNVVSGRDCITEVPARAAWRVADHYDPDMFAEDKTYARRGGFLPPTVFDPVEFSMAPATLDSIGLIQLLSLRVAGEVLKDARCEGADWYDPARTGVILGVCGQSSTVMPLAARLYAPIVRESALSCGLSERDADEIARKFTAASPAWTEQSFPGSLANVVAGRIANRFGLGAANCTVDAACASSLAAVRMAVGELVEHRADLMVTGGCDADNSLLTFMCFSKTPALSPSGLIKPLDRSADGTLLGEGIGMLALKRLADAERDGDRVYAVLRGLGGSSDGRTSSIYAPCGDGQLQALRRAYADADASVGSVELIEAHGTGTTVGDATELAALSTLLEGSGGGSGRVAIGSVKSQIGHTKAAAGAAGLIKTALALHHKLLPPTINSDEPHEKVAGSGALYLNTRARPWVRDPRRPVRRGGVSSFGFGGVNFHAVLEEHRSSDAHARTLHGAPKTYLWHAPDPDALLGLLREGADPEPAGPVPAHHARLGILATDDENRAALTAEAVDRLGADPDARSWSLSGRAHYRRAALPAGTKVAALFAGQGSQYVDMGLDALLCVPPVREAFDEANALWPGEEDSLAQVVYPAPGRHEAHESARRLRRTSYAQPAIGALAMGQYRFLSELGFAPQALLGHSCGELTALWAAGSLTDEACLTLTRKRGQAMEPPTVDGHDPGAMAAARMSVDTWEERAAGHPRLTLCNLNAPDELVVGGPTAAVDRFTAECAGGGVAVHRLPVAAAFHTPLVQHAADDFTKAVAEVDMRPPTTPVLANTPGAAYGSDTAANRRTLAEQLLHPVDFAGRVRQLYAEGFRVFVEFGPKQVLSRLVLRTLDENEVEAVPTDLGPDADSAAALKNAALRLAVLGVEIAGIDRYDAPAPPERPEPSAVARLLEGHAFAVEACRPRYEAALANGYRCTPAVPAPAPASAAERTPPDRTDGDRTDGDLARAATEQLDLHAQYMESQLHTARRLADLLHHRTEDGADPALLSRVEAVRDHSVALSQAHIRTHEIMLEFARLRHGTTAETGPTDATSTSGSSGERRPDSPHSSVEDTPGAAHPVDGAHPHATVVPAPRPAAAGPATHGAAQDDPPDTGPREETVASETAAHSLEPADIERFLRELVAEKTGYTFDMVDPGLDIQTDLGIDSLKQVEIAAEAWRRYPFLPREEIYRFAQARTVKELVALLAEVAAPGAGHTGTVDQVPLGRAFVTLRPLPEADALADAYGPHPTALLLDDGSALAAGLARALSEQGWHTRQLTLPGLGAQMEERWALGDWQEETLSEQIGNALASVERLDLCVLPVGRGDRLDTTSAITRLSHAVLVAKHLAPALKDTAAAGHRAGFVTVSQMDGALGLAGSGGDLPQALAGGLGGLVKALAVEEPGLFCRALDFAPGLAPAAVADRFLVEITDAAPLREIAWDGTTRHALTVSGTPAPLLPATAVPTTPEPHDLLLVTGGARGITSWCLTALAAHHPCGFLLLGRTPLEDLPGWAAGLDSAPALRDACAERARAEGHDPDDPRVHESLDAQARRLDQQREMHATLAALRAHGAEAAYVTADVGDAVAVRAALSPYAERVTGVIHGAGVLADQPLRDKSAQDVARVVGAKLTGLINVLDALPADRLRHLVVFTSVSGIYGNGRQTDYAMANEALNRFACAWKAGHPDCRVAALAWGPWRGGMASAQAQELFLQLGLPLLSREEGCAYFVEQMAAGHSDDLVTVLGPTESAFQAPPLPPGADLLRDLDDLAAEPVLHHHSIDGRPVLPMTAAVGWGLNAVERTHPGRPVTEVRDFSVRKGLVLDGTRPPRGRIAMRPQGGQGGTGVRVTIHDDGGAAPLPRYEGVFHASADGLPAPGRLHLPSYGAPSYRAEDRRHPAYDEGFLFHGPLLRGLGPVLAEDDTQLTVLARLRDPELARGAYSGALYSPALSDLLLQAAALLGRRLCGHRCLPVAVEHVELFAPLPDDEPFVIVATGREHNPLDLTCTVTACSPDGAVLQRWNGLKGIIVAPELASRAAWPAPQPVSL
ncbi:SDR family NAD(P)-dependent oxidoreductase [Streptomyces syringium]|uniref:SDR family NAD(P)-dependent oxidoreductase n=1 Tax=Streptomyces syringium TaxID=76729 RepID=UPI0033C65DFA